MDVRLENTLYALGAVIVFQMMVMLASIILKKNIVPTSLIECILRSFFVGLIDKLNRPERLDFALIIRGVITFSIIFSIFCGLSYSINFVMPIIGYPQWTHVVLLFFVLSPIMVLKTAFAVSVEKPMQGAYLSLSHTINQNLVIADKHGLRRSVCKAVALSLTEYVVAPLLFYVWGGVIGAYLYVSLSLFVRLSGRNSKAFTSVFAYLYKIMNFVSSILSVIFIFLSSFFSAGGKPLRVIKSLRHPSMMSEAAIAYAQNITLGGVYQDRLGNSIKSDWIGSGGSTAKLEHKDILRVMIQYGITIFLLIMILLAFFIYT